ncbi:MAG: hypothetical protein WHS65_08955 [Melioribacteraceae bacterium]
MNDLIPVPPQINYYSMLIIKNQKFIVNTDIIKKIIFYDNEENYFNIIKKFMMENYNEKVNGISEVDSHYHFNPICILCTGEEKE